MARVRSLLRIKELHDTVQQQAAKLKEQTEELSTWNQQLEERVADAIGGDRPHRPPAALSGAAGGAR